MEKFTTVTSILAPLPLRDVDTDLIIPAQYLTSVSRDGYGHALFKRLREQNPDFVLNTKPYNSATCLLVGENFGCGSSREHAVWALQGAGIKAVIGSSFADIFHSNSAKNGLLLVKLTSAETAQLFAACEKSPLEVTIDLKDQRVTVSGGPSFNFDYDPFRKTCLLEGLEDLDYLLRYREKITEYFARR